MKSLIIFIFSIILITSSYSQSFEGKLVYKMELKNPSTDMFTEEQWSKVLENILGDKKFTLQQYYYKNENFYSELDFVVESGYQMYSPKEKLIYSWRKGSDTAMTEHTTVNSDKFISVKDTNLTEIILGIPCKAIVIRSEGGYQIIYYNSDHFKMDPNLYEGHKYGFYDVMLKKIGCLPMKTILRSMMGHVVQTMTEYQAMSIDDSKFILPKFKQVNLKSAY